MTTKIEHVVAFVTGGSSGMGKAIVEFLVSNGGRAVIADINDAGQDIAKQLGENAVFVHTDVASENDVREALRLTKEKFGKLNVVINCAGIEGGEFNKDFLNDPHSIDNWRKIFEVNTYGTFNVTKLAAQLMNENEPDEDQQRGIIVNIASVAGHGEIDGIFAYTASKAAVIGLTDPFARALAPLGIRIVTVSPGTCDTPLLRSSLSTEAQNFFISEQLNPVRLAKPEEIVHLIKCLIENHFINAQVIRIDAGYRSSNKEYERSVQYFLK